MNAAFGRKIGSTKWSFTMTFVWRSIGWHHGFAFKSSLSIDLSFWYWNLTWNQQIRSRRCTFTITSISRSIDRRWVPGLIFSLKLKIGSTKWSFTMKSIWSSVGWLHDLAFKSSFSIELRSWHWNLVWSRKSTLRFSLEI